MITKEVTQIGGHNLISEFETYCGKYPTIIVEDVNAESPYGDCL